MFWYENEALEVEKKKQALDLSREYFVFYGSSSFNYWQGDIEEDLEIQPVFNAAFGGSTLAACCWYFPRLFKSVKAKAMVLYAGDNDIGDLRHSEEIYIYFSQLVCQFKARYPGKPLVFVSIKPSLARHHLKERIYHANQHIKVMCERDKNLFYVDIFNAMLDESGKADSKYFMDDGLHMNRCGYELWIAKLKPVLKDLSKL